ncbi:MAG TPA: hypothetical protein VMN79_05210 [Casimicrobiaceae bacterium]|nr:hypothetical protein [Casimicrobiaceae bacterium]
MRASRAQRAANRALVSRIAVPLVVLLAMARSLPSLADAPQEVHGSGDAYAARGVALAWGILHGADEASTQVVLRIAADPQVYPLVAAVARNPFSGKERGLQPPTSTSAPVELRVPRALYAEFPRTELRFYGSQAALAAATPALVVFYLGVPDTTPELMTEANLEAYLADRISRARAAGGTKP